MILRESVTSFKGVKVVKNETFLRSHAPPERCQLIPYGGVRSRWGVTKHFMGVMTLKRGVRLV